MTDRRTFLRNISLLTLGGIASQKVMASNPTRSIPATDAVSSATAGKKDGIANLFARTGVTARYA